MIEPGDRPLRVLAVDDHPVNRMVLQTILELVAAEVTLAEDGAQAVAAFRADDFDIVLMDLSMPVMDGVAATAAIRAYEQDERRPRTPLLVVTANPLPELIQEAMIAGADHHLAKPVTPESLLQGIEAAKAAAAREDGSRRLRNAG
jgi:CheY-like chemotaxis protein